MFNEIKNFPLLDRAVRIGHAAVVGTEITDNSSLYHLFSPTLASPVVNCVFYSSFSVQELENELERISSLHQKAEVPLWWLVGQTNRPENTKELLLAKKFEFAFDAYGMFAPTNMKISKFSQEVSIEVVSEINYWLYWEVQGKTKTPELELWMKKTLAGDFGAIKMYVAKIEGRAVGITAYRLMKNKLAFLMSGFVLPEFRKQGIYRALLSKRMQDLSDAGVELAVTMAKSDSSAPICRALGFQEFGHYEMFSLQSKYE